jgi:amidase
VLASVIEAGLAVRGTDLQKVWLRRMALRGRVAALFGSVDLLLVPVHPFASPTVAMMRTLGEQPALVSALLRYTCPFDMTGHPAITLPGGATAAGLPLAFQLVAAHMDEAALVRAGAAFQRVTRWHQRRPQLG